MSIFGVGVLRNRWCGEIGRGGGDTVTAVEVFADLTGRYDEPTRHYHNFHHVGQVLTMGCSLVSAAPPALPLAIFLHDVIYDTHAGDNEERSAEYAHRVLKGLGVSREICLETARLILLTKTHETTADDPFGQALLDADLSILSETEAVYDAYAAAIRREYAWVSDDDYRAGRCRVLERFLARPRLYFTEWMFEHGEQRARANLAREIARLA
jgi:predicted metal-dependent HD superfamily phosphohydrolase